MWSFWLHIIHKFFSISDKLSVILFDLWPHKVITINIVVGFDEYLLNKAAANAYWVAV